MTSKLSDIFLDDKTIALITEELQVGKPDGDNWSNPVVVKGNMRFRDRLYISEPPSLSVIAQGILGNTMPAFGKPTARPSLAGELGVIVDPSGSAGTLAPAHGTPSPALHRLKVMKPPYELWDILECMRLAILDLQSRVG
ncbi:MAG: hypothetical protein ACXVEE_26505 [Polyangiales bacterium]